MISLLKKFLFISTIFLWIPSVFLSCGKSPKKDGKVKELFSIVLKKGNVLSDTTIENVEYPSDFQYYDGKLYILSGDERKVVVYDLKDKRLKEFEQINNTLKILHERDAAMSDPTYIRIIDGFIIIDCNNKVFIFDKGGKLLKKLTFKSNIQFITAEGDNLYIWTFPKCIIVRLANKFQLEKINAIKELIYTPEDDMIADACDIYTDRKGFRIVKLGDSLVMKLVEAKQIKLDDYPEVKKENVSLNCVTPSYYVWYSWVIGPEFFIINRNNGATTKIPLSINITKGYLSEEEGGPSTGFKITNNGDDALYMMVMKRENKQKRIIIYELDL